MKRFGEKDTSFPGARETPEKPEAAQNRDQAEHMHFHNWVDAAFHARTRLARLCLDLSRKSE